MALAKSVGKLLLAASVSYSAYKVRLIVITWYFMFADELTSRFELLLGSGELVVFKTFGARHEFK